MCGRDCRCGRLSLTVKYEVSSKLLSEGCTEVQRARWAVRGLPGGWVGPPGLVGGHCGQWAAAGGGSRGQPWGLTFCPQ